MNEEAEVYLSKANESLATAESEFAAGRYNSCANRCYYGCFQAAIAALIHTGIASPRQNVWNHGYVQAEFNGQLINRRKIYPARLRAILGQNRDVRDRGDYSVDHVSQTQAHRALNRCRDCVNTVHEILETEHG